MAKYDHRYFFFFFLFSSLQIDILQTSAVSCTLPILLNTCLLYACYPTEDRQTIVFEIDIVCFTFQRGIQLPALNTIWKDTLYVSLTQHDVLIYYETLVATN